MHLSELPVFFDYLKLILLNLTRKRNQENTVVLLDYKVRYDDIRILRAEFKDIFKNKIYHFVSNKPEPIIVDGGGYIGMSVMYFKYIYPNAKITVFEPDCDTAQLLRKNIANNKLKDVTIVEAGLYSENGEIKFVADRDKGRICESGSEKINVKKLSSYIDTNIDFLKLNVEGSELAVLRDLETTDKIKHVGEMIIEWHFFPNSDQNLDEGLALLRRNGFRYLINHFDYKTNPSLKPPFNLKNKAQFYLLVYAKRVIS